METWMSGLNIFLTKQTCSKSSSQATFVAFTVAEKTWIYGIWAAHKNKFSVHGYTKMNDEAYCA